VRPAWAINGTAIWHPEVISGADSVGGAPAISAHYNGVTIVSLNYGRLFSTAWWAANGSSTWTPSAKPGGDDTLSSIVSYPGIPAVPPHPGKQGGVDVATAELSGYMGVSSSVGGSGTWTSTQVISGPLSAPVHVSSNPSTTLNNGSVNIAVEGQTGDLWFYWEDSSGAFHQETVDTSANLS
jgi:hypothetical protein